MVFNRKTTWATGHDTRQLSYTVYILNTYAVLFQNHLSDLHQARRDTHGWHFIIYGNLYRHELYIPPTRLARWIALYCNDPDPSVLRWSQVCGHPKLGSLWWPYPRNLRKSMVEQLNKQKLSWERDGNSMLGFPGFPVRFQSRQGFLPFLPSKNWLVWK